MKDDRFEVGDWVHVDWWEDNQVFGQLLHVPANEHDDWAMAIYSARFDHEKKRKESWKANVCTFQRYATMCGGEAPSNIIDPPAKGK